MGKFCLKPSDRSGENKYTVKIDSDHMNEDNQGPGLLGLWSSGKGCVCLPGEQFGWFSTLIDGSRLYRPLLTIACVTSHNASYFSHTYAQLCTGIRWQISGYC